MKIKTKPLEWKDLTEGIEIDIPILEQNVSGFKNKLSNVFTKKITIYNDIPGDGVNPRRFDRFVVELCNIQKGVLQNSDGTIEKVVNAQTVITKDVKRYKAPMEYALLPADEKEKFFTANVNDFVVLAEVDDVVNTSREFQELQNKYRNNGFSVTAVNEYVYGLSVDNIQIIHA